MVRPPMSKSSCAMSGSPANWSRCNCCPANAPIKGWPNRSSCRCGRTNSNSRTKGSSAQPLGTRPATRRLPALPLAPRRQLVAGRADGLAPAPGSGSGAGGQHPSASPMGPDLLRPRRAQLWAGPRGGLSLEPGECRPAAGRSARIPAQTGTHPHGRRLGVGRLAHLGHQCPRR